MNLPSDVLVWLSIIYTIIIINNYRRSILRTTLLALSVFMFTDCYIHDFLIWLTEESTTYMYMWRIFYCLIILEVINKSVKERGLIHEKQVYIVMICQLKILFLILIITESLINTYMGIVYTKDGPNYILFKYYDVIYKYGLRILEIIIMGVNVSGISRQYDKYLYNIKRFSIMEKLHPYIKIQRI